ncbi:hypothetical protein K488DRAFT_70309 [Vararia minispora EC-137]|uniref:Uncharacterized protein n=1 Tax=Vararia minispora EC-137 TaxID=1314806 RepID=A0ACB8QMM9_9AGAM|nr:hypothetical protein K488DRAFT_70309 [Vararia minispora EC-137]
MYNYTWNKETREDFWTYERGDKKDTVPARIPITVLLEGPIAGGPFPVSDWRPPAVTTEFFEEVCPHPTVISVADARGGDVSDSTGAEILARVVEKLHSIEDNCVEFQDGSGMFFDYWLWADGARMASTWSQLLESPIVTAWRWSDLVRKGVEANRAIVHPRIVPHDHHRNKLPGLLALHLRRGDFQQHCEHIGKWRLPHNAWNSHPEFVDTWNPPEGGGNGEATSELRAYYLKHCYPEIDQIVERVEEVYQDAARQGRKLDRIYILTNGEYEWLEELKDALGKVRRWESVATSRDLEVNWEQKYVAQAIDQVIATRAEVFLGNALTVTRAVALSSAP